MRESRFIESQIVSIPEGTGNRLPIKGAVRNRRTTSGRAVTVGWTYRGWCVGAAGALVRSKRLHQSTAPLLECERAGAQPAWSPIGSDG